MEEFYKSKKGNLTIWIQKENNIKFATMAASFSRTDIPTQTLLQTKFSGEVNDELIGLIFAEYGDKSVGKLINISLIVDGMSIYDAMCLKESRIGNACIEASTRYLNFSNTSHTGDNPLIADWLSLYSRMLPVAEKHIRETKPREKEIELPAYESAVKAEAFDICREMLPMAMVTRLGATINFLTLTRNIHKWRRSDRSAVCDLAELLTNYVQEHLPYLVKALDNDHSPYINDVETIIDGDIPADEPFETPIRVECLRSTPTQYMLNNECHRLNARTSRHKIIPRELEKDLYECTFSIPFHAARDMMRHVFVTKTKCFIDPGYVSEVLAFKDETSPLMAFKSEFNNWLTKTIHGHTDISVFPMCTRMDIEMTINLRSLIYMTELRTSDGVHPTIYSIFDSIAKSIMPYFKMLNVDKGVFFTSARINLARLESERRKLRRQQRLKKLTPLVVEKK